LPAVPAPITPSLWPLFWMPCCWGTAKKLCWKLHER